MKAQRVLRRTAPRLGAHRRGSASAARLLYQALEPLGWARALRQNLNRAPTRIDRLAESELGEGGTPGDRNQAMHRILEVLALARASAGDVPLLPVRIHATVRGPHGIYACLNGSCTQVVLPGALGKLYTEPVGKCECGCGVYELRVCDSCRQSFVLGRRASGTTGLRLWYNRRCEPRLVVMAARARVTTRAMCRSSAFRIVGTMASPFQRRRAWPRRSSRSVPTLLHAAWDRAGPYGGSPAVISGAGAHACGRQRPRCSTQLPRRASVRRIEAGTDAALLALIDGVYPSLPMHRSAVSRRLRGEGRRLLLFADNRQWRLRSLRRWKSHTTRLARRLIVEALDLAVEPGRLCQGRGDREGDHRGSDPRRLRNGS